MHTSDGRRLKTVANFHGFILPEMQASQIYRDCSEGLLPDTYTLTKEEKLSYI